MKMKFFTLLFAILASVGTVCADSGTCGKNLTWDLTNGVLTISGTGSMANYNLGSAPWFSWHSNIKTVDIQNGVTSIGSYAFFNCSSLTSVSIGDSVTNIGAYAFSGCTGLPVINNIRYADKCLIEVVNKTLSSYIIKDDTRLIGSNAFRDCKVLTSISIPDSVKSIGENAFYDCSNMTSVTIGNGVTSIGGYAFYGCSSLNSVTIGNSVTSIKNYAFHGCSDLVSVTLPNSVTSIGSETFDESTIVFMEPIERPIYIQNPNIVELDTIKALTNSTFISIDDLTSIPAFSCVSDLSIGEISATEYGWVTNVNFTHAGSLYTKVIKIERKQEFNYIRAILQAEEIVHREGYGTLLQNAYMHSIYENTKSITDIYAQTGYKFGREDDHIAISLYEGEFRKGDVINIYTTNNGDIGDSLYLYSDKDGNNYLTSIKKLSQAGLHSFVLESEFNGINTICLYRHKGSSRDMNPYIAYLEITRFEPSQYEIKTQPNNPMYGVTLGDTIINYGDTFEIQAIPSYGYDFGYWDPYYHPNRRHYYEDGRWYSDTLRQTDWVIATEDKTFTAYFYPKRFNVSCASEDNNMGVVFANNKWYVYMDSVTIIAQPNYGYHFTQWNDGNTDNPRTFILTRDTIFTASFAVDKSGSCGDNLALLWEYETDNRILTISGNGTLNSNYTFGVEAPQTAEKLIIKEGVTTIGNSAFANYSTIKHISIPTTVKTIYEQAFYNCTGLEQIFSYRAKPSTAYSNTFDGIDKFECTLHVLAASVDMYKAATGWRDFYYIQTIDAEDVTESVDDVIITPTNTTAGIIWPYIAGAVSYEIVIRDFFGNVICQLTFNASGHLIGIAFAPSRNNQSQSTQTTGFQFTITGLNSGTSYAYSVEAKDEADQTIDTKSGTFTTTSEVPTGVDNISNAPFDIPQKVMINNQILILRGDKTYTLQGQEVK